MNWLHTRFNAIRVDTITRLHIVPDVVEGREQRYEVQAVAGAYMIPIGKFDCYATAKLFVSHCVQTFEHSNESFSDEQLLVGFHSTQEEN